MQGRGLKHFGAHMSAQIDLSPLLQGCGLKFEYV